MDRCLVAVVDSEVDNSRSHGATEGCRYRNNSLARVAKVAHHELFFQLQASEKEEDRQQAVSRPEVHVHHQVAKAGNVEAEFGVADALVEARCLGVSQDDGKHGGGEQNKTTHRFLAHNL